MDANNETNNTTGQEPGGAEFSKVELVRELIVGPDRREIEAQITGMRDLFTSLLIENKKEYDRQIGEMKNLFVSAMDENRRVFQQQVQEMYQSLPRMVEKNLNAAQKEGFVYLSENKVAEKNENDRIEKYTRLEAITEILLGEQRSLLNERIGELQQQIDRDFGQQQNDLQNLSAEMMSDIQAFSTRVNAAFEQLYSGLSAMLEDNNRRQSHRELLSAYFEQVARQIVQ